MVKRMSVGIIGCGNISETYLKSAKAFPLLDLRAVADLDPNASRKRASQFNLQAMTVDELLADPSIEMVINLTVPKAHLPVGLSIIAAGKHLYSEKPLGLSSTEAAQLLAEAAHANLRVGCAPDTFLGGAHQTCRKLVDEGAIGRPLGGTAIFMCPGHERWHPAPGFYYVQGGGPVFDMGPYYITALVNLLGPVSHVMGMTSRPHESRLVTSAPLAGTKLPVEVDTHVAGLLQFRNGAIVNLIMSFDVQLHRHTPMELYGTAGTLVLPDPDEFGGTAALSMPNGEWTSVHPALPFTDRYCRIVGAADMAQAIREGRPHRASGALAAHVLDVIESIGRSSQTAIGVEIASSPSRPAPLGRGDLSVHS